MARMGTSVTAEAIRIEDEVWQEAFQARVPSPRRASARRAALATVDERRRPPAPTAVSAAQSRVSGPRGRAVEPAGGRAVEPAGGRAAEPAGGRAVEPAGGAAAGSLAPAGRRTVKIQGRGADLHRPAWGSPATRRRPPRTLHERAGFRPDRIAMWAVFLGLALVVVAALSGHG
jgi:hypothetical protein